VIVAINAPSVERFRAAVTGRLGLQFDDTKTEFLADVLRRRIDAAGGDVHGYLSCLETQPAKEELGALAEELTVPETYFFRHLDQYRALTETVLPACLTDPSTARRVRILSLGCASGEEPYTLAMLVRDTLPAWDASIVGVDINPAVLAKASRGRFSAWALRETPEEDRQRWFRPEGRDFVLTEALRASVRFEQRNLVDDDPQLWQHDTYDVVFCRNVIMYFSPAQARAVVDHIARALRSGGFLFLGHAETLRGVSNEFHLLHTHGTFYYQKKEHSEARPSISTASCARPTQSASLVTAAADADTWVEAIRRASDRVIALTDADAPPEGRPRSAAAAPPAWDRGHVLELLRSERYAEALAVINTLPPESAVDPDVRLLRAVLLAHAGRLPDAEDACRHVLDVDELSAGAHYLLALCREGARDCSAARHHDQVAAYLDPGFAMPRLHLGLLARRAGDREAARKELGQALALLQREDAARVLLFGGGFSREALIALCRAELERCGAQG
jgi:chemotaxis protein methyltransferase CheR